MSIDLFDIENEAERLLLKKYKITHKQLGKKWTANGSSEQYISKLLSKPMNEKTRTKFNKVVREIVTERLERKAKRRRMRKEKGQ